MGKITLNKKTGQTIRYAVNSNGCWICVSHKPEISGYPRIKCKGVHSKAHRHVYKLYNGDIPESVLIRHTCDERTCINPAHLIPGSHADNIRDAVERGRMHSKLTKEQVLEIRAIRTGTFTEIAKKYNVSPATISGIKNGKSWGHLKGVNEIFTSTHKPGIINIRKSENGLTPEQVLEIKSDFTHFSTDLAKKYKVHEETIRNVRNGKSWKHIKTKVDPPNTNLPKNRGEAHFSAKLTNNQAYEIKYNEKSSQKSLSIKYNVSITTIQKIQQNKKWKHI